MITAGEECADLLHTPSYNLAVRSVMEALRTEWQSSEPHEQQKREWLYQQARALGEVQWQLANFVNHARQVSSERMAAEEVRQREYDHGYQSLDS